MARSVKRLAAACDSATTGRVNAVRGGNEPDAMNTSTLNLRVCVMVSAITLLAHLVAASAAETNAAFSYSTLMVPSGYQPSSVRPAIASLTLGSFVRESRIASANS